MKKETAKRITMYVDSETYRQFQILAIKLGVSVSKLVEEFMKEKLKKGE